MKSLIALILTVAATSSWALTIGAYNIRNFDYDVRYQIHTNKPELSGILKSLNFDVLSVEEINNTAEFEKFVTNQMPGYATTLSTCGGQNNQRLGFIYNTRTVELLSFNEDLTIADPGQEGNCYAGSRPLAIALFQIKGSKQKFYGMTAHLKSGSNPESAAKRQKQFQVLKEIISELRNKSGIKDYFVAGDLNTTDYISRGHDYKNLNQLVNELGSVHLTANFECSAYWWGGTDDGIESPSLLDHIIASPGLIKARAKTEIHGHCQKVSCREASLGDLGVSYESVSDHCPLTATVQ